MKWKHEKSYLAQNRLRVGRKMQNFADARTNKNFLCEKRALGGGVPRVIESGLTG